MKILLLMPRIIYESWPIPTDFHRHLKKGAGSTFAQLAAVIPEHPCDIFDGNVTDISQQAYEELLRGYDVIGISVVSSSVALNTEITVRLIKRICPRTVVILGGHHATFHHREWLQRGADIVVRQEGEQTFREVITALHQGQSLSPIKGISFLDGHREEVNPDREMMEDLDSLPMPLWHKVDLSRYTFNLGGQGHAAAVETSRGCSQKCLFCLASAMWGHTQRYKSVERVVDEIRLLHQSGVDNITISDDNFGAHYQRDRELLQELIRLDLGIHLWMFVRADSFLKHPDLLELSVRAGLKEVIIGYESLDRDTLRTFHKNVDASVKSQDFQRVYEQLKGHGVLVYGAFLEDNFTGKSSRETMAQATGLCDVPMVQEIIPMRGIEGYDLLQKNNQLSSDPFYHDRNIKVYPHGRSLLHGAQALRSLFNRNVLDIFISGRTRQQQEILKLYYHILRDILHVSPRKIADRLICSWPWYSAEEKHQRIIRQYLDRGQN